MSVARCPQCGAVKAGQSSPAPDRNSSTLMETFAQVLLLAICAGIFAGGTMCGMLYFITYVSPKLFMVGEIAGAAISGTVAYAIANFDQFTVGGRAGR